jgi:hypothetical protein
MVDFPASHVGLQEAISCVQVESSPAAAAWLRAARRTAEGDNGDNGDNPMDPAFSQRTNI